MGDDYKNRGRFTRDQLIDYAVDKVDEDTKLTIKEKIWLIAILQILKDGGYVRVLADNCLIDIMDVAETPSYAASFWDVYNHLDRFCINADPIRISKIENDFHNLAKNE